MTKLETIAATINAHPCAPSKLHVSDTLIIAEYGERQVELRVDEARYGQPGYEVTFSCWSASGTPAELVAQAALLAQVGALAVALEAMLSA